MQMIGFCASAIAAICMHVFRTMHLYIQYILENGGKICLLKYVINN